MPTVTVRKQLLLQALFGNTEEATRFTDENFDDLCFRFGIELDDVTTEKEINRKQGLGSESLSDEVVYKIEVPANRYDILCLEGISRALRIFLEKEAIPDYKIIIPPPDKIFRIHQKKETAAVRPFVVGCILRNISFNEATYNSFMDLQDKLHQNIGRRRQLVAIGTHDLDTILGNSASYQALPKDKIVFQPLAETKEFRVDELFEYYKKKANCHLRPYLSITEKSPVHPVIYDAKNVVLSLPPIINGEHSKISLKTKNVFIECTGTDFTKLNITLNTMIAMFSQYCGHPFEVEAVEIIDEANNKRFTTPDMREPSFNASVDQINRTVGINLNPTDMAKLLNRMQLRASYDDKNKNLIVKAPVTRSDILHTCDIIEDVAIAYGYNNLAHTVPQCYTVGVPDRINKLSDQLREVVAQVGFVEVLTWALVSMRENYNKLQQSYDGRAVLLENAKSVEFEVVRTSLLPGLLKTLNSNIGQTSLPIRIFELSDVVLIDPSVDTGARNHRRLGALFCGASGGFEIVHALLDRIMTVNDVGFEPIVRQQLLAREKRLADKSKDASSSKTTEEEELDEELSKLKPWVYRLSKSENHSFFHGRSADIILTKVNKDGSRDEKRVGVFGVFHPDVLQEFALDYPVAALELDIEPFLELTI